MGSTLARELKHVDSEPRDQCDLMTSSLGRPDGHADAAGGAGVGRVAGHRTGAAAAADGHGSAEQLGQNVGKAVR